MNSRRQRSVNSIRALLDIASAQLPREIVGEIDAELPELVCSGLLARQIELAESVLDLERRPTDSSKAILIRSMFDHAVTMAWIAADDSSDRIQRFRKTDAKRRLDIEKDAQKFGESILSPKIHRDLEAQVSSLPSEMPNLKQRAENADEFWIGKIPGLGQGPASTYLGLYAFAYRNHSTLEHASRMGLNAVVDDVGEGRKLVHLEVLDLRRHGPLGQAAILLGLSLLVLSVRFEWPGQQGVLDAFENGTALAFPRS